MKFISVQEFSDKWHISKRRIQILCREGRIQGARMAGNAWVIPEDAGRPMDARKKSPVASSSNEPFGVRRGLKLLLRNLYKRTENAEIAVTDQKTYVLSAIACGLCIHYLGRNALIDQIYQTICGDISGTRVVPKIDAEVMEEICSYIECYKDDPELDSILSWAYQYSNQYTEGNRHSRTQFFTEKYMIQYLIKNVGSITKAAKIVDPCAGGGNFLAECLEYACDKEKTENLPGLVMQYAGKLYGYDIDDQITHIALVNIRLRALAVLNRRNADFSFEIWSRISPNIYRSKENDNISGSLSRDYKAWINIVSGQETGMADVLGNADVILTNPPFATMKGMAQEQKDFLKRYYPDANCDTCVCFLDAVYDMLNPAGMCGIVTQNAWMHLKSFQKIREKFTLQYTLYKIIDLGSGAFQDLSGEKSNVSLIILGRKAVQDNRVDILNLNTMSLKEKITALGDEKEYIRIAQNEINGNNGYNLSGKKILENLDACEEHYKDIAVPMQGTSTGNARELVGYFWEHFGEEDWVSVSNGGGYCRWQGLNDCVVKWGKEGEYIKEQKGSALRNVKYFPETQMVFSDTGTAGLNVRILLEHQIFIASGPGIRIKKGDTYAHLALLNSRLAAYFVRTMSPKLTIAAGYIGQIPVNRNIYSSVMLEKDARQCVELKRKVLSVRPNNLEYDSVFMEEIPGELDKAATLLFHLDITNELHKLELESKMDRYICQTYGFSDADRELLDMNVGECAYLIDGTYEIDFTRLDKYMDSLLDASCCLKRTRTSKNTLGCDGIIEYIARDLNVNPEVLVKGIRENASAMKRVLARYRTLLVHNSILSYLGYNVIRGIEMISCRIDEIISFLSDRFGKEMDYKEWICRSFNGVHKEIFKGVPYLKYENGVICKNDFRTAG